MRDKRRCSRTPVEIPVEFTLWDPKHVAFGFVTDLTLTGAAVSTEFPLRRGSNVVMRMWRPAWDEEIVVSGAVRWARGRRMGVQLASLPEATRDRLREQLVASRPTSRSPERDPRRTTHLGLSTRILALVGMSAR
ncbi:MAG: PilZ domain-containing protein [Polyangiaceae bacterium]